MNLNWAFFIDIGILSAGLLLASFLRVKIRFLQRFLVPNALTAGFLLLFFYNFAAPKLGLSSGGLGDLAYHLLNISFIAMTLRKVPAAHKKGDHTIVATSVSVLSQYAVQALLGLFGTLFFIKTFFPDLIPSFGFLLPMGFSLGPGQAYNIGRKWVSFGFEGADSIGLSFAALGFLWGCFGGVFLINYGVRKGWMKEADIEAIQSKNLRSGFLARNEKKPDGARLSTDSEAIDSMTWHIAVIMFIYLFCFLFLSGLEKVLSFAGPLGRDLAESFWSINFIFSSLAAMLAKAIFNRAKIDYTLDTTTLTRVSGLSVDLMVAASLAAISLTVVLDNWIPLLVISTLAGIAALLMVPWFCSRIFTDHRFARMLMIFGVATGTLTTGLALLRVIDPDFEKPVASDYMLSAGLTFVLAIPFILIIDLPLYSYTRNDPSLFWMAVLISFAYLAFVLAAYAIISRRRSILAPGKLWLRPRRG